MGVNNNAPINISPSLDKSQTAAYINENFRKISDAFNPLKISDGNFDRIIFGKYADGTYGIAYYDEYGNLSSTTDGRTITKYDTSGNLLSVDDGNKTVYYDANDARILIGKAPDGTMGIYVSKVGVDVVTELGG